MGKLPPKLSIAEPSKPDSTEFAQEMNDSVSKALDRVRRAASVATTAIDFRRAIDIQGEAFFEPHFSVPTVSRELFKAAADALDDVPEDLDVIEALLAPPRTNDRLRIRYLREELSRLLDLVKEARGALTQSPEWAEHEDRIREVLAL